MASGAKSKAPAPRKTQSKQKAPERGIWREVTGISLIGVGAVLLYFVLMKVDSGAGVAIVRVLTGLAGAMRVMIPLIFVWVGFLVIFSGREESWKISRIALASLIPVLLMTAVHLFFVDEISRSMRIYSYWNFLSQTYGYTGGGAGIGGALLAWPLHYSLGLGEAGGTMVIIILVLADLVLLRKISLHAIGVRVREGYDGYRERSTQRAEERFALREQREAERAREAQNQSPPRQSARSLSRGSSANPREMVIERIVPDDKLPNKPIPPRDEPGAEPAYDNDIPLFLSSKDRARKKKGAQPEPLRVDEPERIVKERRKPPVNDEPFNLEHAVDSGDPDDLYARFEAENEPYDDSGVEDDSFVDLADELSELDERFDPDEPPFEVKKPVAASKPPAPKRDSVKPVEEEPYNFPPIDLLEASKPSKVRNQEQLDAEKAEKLLDALASFGITATLLGIAHGPTVTRFELSPAPGIKVSRITSLADDIALNLAAISVRIEAPIPGKAAVGVEVPNDDVETVPLRDVLESAEARKHPSRIMAALGRDNAGRNIVADLAKMPHVLIAGATGAGKSVCINCIICSILYRATPDEVKLIMIDPKVVELSAYNGIPHLLAPVVTDPKKAASALNWAVNEMSVRYRKFAQIGVRDMKGFNQRRPEDEPAMPQIVIIIDELADLMMVAPGEVEDSVCRLAQLARAAGIHLVIATQRPSVNVITGVIKANIPSRVAFTVASQVDSRTILDMGGAEKLLGRGDMLFAPSGTNKPVRVQGAWISDDEVNEVVEFIKVRHDAEYDEDVIEHMNNAELSDQEKEDAQQEFDELLPQAVEIVIEAGQASISMLQRKLRVGYARAGRLIDEMATRGIVSQAEGAKPRSVLYSREQCRMLFGE